MPILNVKVTAAKSPRLIKQIAATLLDATERILHKKRTVSAIAIEQGKNSFYFNIKITNETNAKDEKAQYIKEVFAGFEKILCNLHEEGYIYVQDVRAASYGYGGYTQEYRYYQK